MQANLKKKEAARTISRSARSGLQFPVGRCMCVIVFFCVCVLSLCYSYLLVCPPYILGVGNGIAARQGSSKLEGGRGLPTQQQES